MHAVEKCLQLHYFYVTKYYLNTTKQCVPYAHLLRSFYGVKVCCRAGTISVGSKQFMKSILNSNTIFVSLEWYKNMKFIQTFSAPKNFKPALTKSLKFKLFNFMTFLCDLNFLSRKKFFFLFMKFSSKSHVKVENYFWSNTFCMLVRSLALNLTK